MNKTQDREVILIFKIMIFKSKVLTITFFNLNLNIASTKILLFNSNHIASLIKIMKPPFYFLKENLIASTLLIKSQNIRALLK